MKTILTVTLQDDLVCQYCLQGIFPGYGVYAVKHIGRSTIQMMFCCEACAIESYMHKLKQSGFEAAPCDTDTHHWLIGGGVSGSSKEKGWWSSISADGAVNLITKYLNAPERRGGQLTLLWAVFLLYYGDHVPVEGIEHHR